MRALNGRLGDQAEIVALWIMKDLPRGGISLIERRRRRCSEIECCHAGDRKVVDHDVEMEPVLASLAFGNPLEAKQRTALPQPCYVDPVRLSPKDLRAEESGPELCLFLEVIDINDDG